MTSSDLYNEFINGNKEGFTSWVSIVGPYLALPRSVKNDPPTSGKIIAVRRGKHGTLIDIFDLDVNKTELHELQQRDWTHWLPLPEIPDEAADEAWQRSSGFVDPKEAFFAGFNLGRQCKK